MGPAAAEKRKEPLRRVSRTRILDGHPFQTGLTAVAVMVGAYVLITVAISLLFSYFHKVSFVLVLWTLAPGALLGYALLIVERLLRGLKAYTFSQMGKLLTAFLLFFAHTIAYLVLSSTLVNYFLGYLMGKFWGMPDMAGRYSLFSANFFILLAVLSWLRNMRTLPCRCL